MGRKLQKNTRRSCDFGIPAFSPLSEKSNNTNLSSEALSDLEQPPQLEITLENPDNGCGCRRFISWIA